MSWSAQDAQLNAAPTPVAGDPADVSPVPGSSGTRAPYTGPVPISSLSAALVTRNIDNTNLAQNWLWSTLTTGTGLTLSADAVTSGQLFRVSSAATAFTGNLVALQTTGNNVANTGNLVALSTSGPDSSITPLKISNGGKAPGIDVQGALVFRAADHATTGVQNDVALPNASTIRYSGAGTATFTGLLAAPSGQQLLLENAGTGNLTLANLNGGSAAANRINTGTGGNVVLPVGASATLVYDATAAQWRLVSVGPGATLYGTTTIAIGQRDSAAVALGASFVGALVVAQIQQAATDATLLYVERSSIDGAGNLVIRGGPANATAVVTVAYAVHVQ